LGAGKQHFYDVPDRIGIDGLERSVIPTDSELAPIGVIGAEDDAPAGAVGDVADVPALKSLAPQVYRT
jgi:hypothetical protein